MQQVQQLSSRVLVEIVGHAVCNVKENKVLAESLRIECSNYCWRALARQLPILYNREKKAKSVGCKIEDLRSKFAFNIRGLLNVETCAVDYGCL